MQVPPTCSRSISAVRRPLRASAVASGPPAWPAPMTMASYRSVALMSSGCLFGGDDPRTGDVTTAGAWKVPGLRIFRQNRLPATLGRVRDQRRDPGPGFAEFERKIRMVPWPTDATIRFMLLDAFSTHDWRWTAVHALQRIPTGAPGRTPRSPGNWVSRPRPGQSRRRARATHWRW